MKRKLPQANEATILRYTLSKHENDYETADAKYLQKSKSSLLGSAKRLQENEILYAALSCKFFKKFDE